MNNSKQTQSRMIDSKDKISKIDKKNVLGSIEALADQIRQAWDATQKLDINLTATPTNITVAGMGGSALGADVVRHAFKDQLKIPFNIINDYTLPAYINSESLVILSSYSGDTEEVLSCADQAKENNAQVLVITQGGKLAEVAQENNYGSYIIETEHNPSNQPRMAIGYAVAGLMGLLNKIKLITIKQAEIEEIIKTILFTMQKCGVEEGTEDNPAKTLSYNLIDRKPNLVAAEFLTGAAHVASNQFNENAKTFANFYQIPEINHHLLEGLKLPKSNKLDNIFLFFNSKLYHEKNQKRMQLTQKAMGMQNIEALKIELESETKLTQVFELITLMAYTNFYLSILLEINPSEIPMVDWFKKQLAQ
jgi:glucose/mannose-6-phosphate isomerase